MTISVGLVTSTSCPWSVYVFGPQIVRVRFVLLSSTWMYWMGPMRTTDGCDCSDIESQLLLVYFEKHSGNGEGGKEWKDVK